MTVKSTQSGFTLVEIAIVLLIVTILLGYTVALFPRQQELKQYRALDREMDEVIEAIIGFAQINGRLPCPGIPNSRGLEDYDDALDTGCNNYGGFVPVNTLGLNGRVNEDSLLLDPWGNPYRYYVTNADFIPPGEVNGNGLSDFTAPQEMRAVGLVDLDGDDYIDLDGRYLICDAIGDEIDHKCGGANEVFGRWLDNGDPADDRYAGAPFVLLSQGKNWNEVAAVNDEFENSGASLTSVHLGMGIGPSGTNYLLKDVSGVVGPANTEQTTFVQRPFSDDFDDVVRWVSPSILYSRMIQAGQLP
jgi:prepilin-type N-terminal cleavage/methylation domain-containing protein